MQFVQPYLVMNEGKQGAHNQRYAPTDERRQLVAQALAAACVNTRPPFQCKLGSQALVIPLTNSKL